MELRRRRHGQRADRDPCVQHSGHVRGDVDRRGRVQPDREHVADGQRQRRCGTSGELHDITVDGEGRRLRQLQRLFERGSIGPHDAATLEEALKLTKSPTFAVDGDVVKLATGAAPALTLTVCDVLAVRLNASATVNVTTNVPAVLNAWVAVRPLPVAPSPKFHE